MPLVCTTWPPQELATDPALESHKRGLIVDAAKQLKAAQVQGDSYLMIPAAAGSPISNQPSSALAPVLAPLH